MLDKLQKLHSWDLFKYGYEELGGFKPTNLNKNDYFDDDIITFFKCFGFPHKPIWHIRIDSGESLMIRAEREEDWLDVGGFHNMKFSISKQNREFYMTNPEHAFACSSMLSFVYWGIVCDAFCDKYAIEESGKILKEEIEIVMSEFQAIEPKAVSLNSYVSSQMDGMAQIFSQYF